MLPFLLALVRSVEHKSASRHLQLGAVCGAVLMFRQELGAAQLLLGAGLVGIVPLWPLRPASFRGGAFLLGLRRVSLVVSGFVAAVIPVFALYAVQGNLVDLLDAVFRQAYQYSNRPMTHSFDSEASSQ